MPGEGRGLHDVSGGGTGHHVPPPQSPQNLGHGDDEGDGEGEKKEARRGQGRNGTFL